MGGQPKAAFYVAVFLVIGALVAFAVYRSDIFAPKGNKPVGENGQGTKLDPKELGGVGGAEAPDATGITTVKVWERKASQALPKVEGTAAYEPMQDRTVKFAINVWAGWAPIILANEGFKAGKAWKTPGGEDFKVDLVLSDDPIAMRGAYAAGKTHIGWATLDMVPLFMEGFVEANDSRVMPRIYQQVDWSNGGDGIVVRENIKTVSDLRGKKIALAENSPSQYFILNMLVAGGVQPPEVEFVFTPDAFQAAAAFNSDKSIAAAVSWAPDIYNLSEVKGNRMLVTTQTANKLIADVWFARADFASENPDIIEGLVRGIFDAMEELKDTKRKQHCAQLMSDGYSIPATDTLAMMGDAHSTNWAENFQFFLNQNNPARFENVWRQSYYVYKQIGVIRHQPVSFDQVMDPSVIEKLGKEDKYKNQKDEYQVQFAPKPSQAVRVEGDEVLTNTVVIHFAPNDWDLNKTIQRNVDGKLVEELYDPNIDFVLNEVAKLVGQLSAARIIIEGHTDGSMKGTVDDGLVKELSANRANAVKQALVEKHKLDANRFNVEGIGWERPADPSDPLNHAKNRRVEIRVFTAEKG